MPEVLGGVNMKKGGKLLIALSMVALKASGGGAHAGAFIGDDLANIVHRCAYYTELDREELQGVLEELLENRPNDDCIPFIVDLLGGAPLAQILSDTASTSEGDFNEDNDDPNAQLILPYN